MVIFATIFVNILINLMHFCVKIDYMLNMLLQHPFISIVLGVILAILLIVNKFLLLKHFCTLFETPVFIDFGIKNLH